MFKKTKIVPETLDRNFHKQKVLNKIIITFTEKNIEAFQYKNEIKTKFGKTFITLKEFINYYRNEEKKRLDKLRYEEKKRLDKSRYELYSSKEYKEKVRQKYQQDEKNKIKKLIDDIDNGRMEKDITIISSNVPDISREKIINMLIKCEGDIVNTIVELGE